MPSEIINLGPSDSVMQQSEGVFILITFGVDEYKDDFEHVVVINAAAGAIID